jgi:hypothetical protein
MAFPQFRYDLVDDPIQTVGGLRFGYPGLSCQTPGEV